MNIDQKRTLLSTCEAIVCDLDGTLYLDGHPIPGAHEFLDRILQSGKKLFYFTNNTSKSRETYIRRLHSLGFPSEDHFLITSADCAESYLRRHGLFPQIYLVGNKDLYADFTRRQFICLNEEQALGGALLKAVVLGFDTELTYLKIRTCYDLILRGVPYLATHADILCPLSAGKFMPDVGSFISMFEKATAGKLPIVVGKPNKEAVEAICDKAQLPPEKIVFVGDRLYTDMRMAQQFNMIGVLALSGETTEDMLLHSPDQPRMVINSIAALTPLL